MLVKFTKMHGLGNDFVVLDTITQRLFLNADQIKRIADRKFGVGCDQVLLLDPPLSADADFSFRIFNQDGTEVGQCGNGGRCIARFVRDMGLHSKDRLLLETKAARMEALFQLDGLIKMNMGIPSFEPPMIPFESPYKATLYSQQILGKFIQFAALSMGNPHAVIVVDDVTSTDDVASVGQALSTHPRFPQGANIGFMQIHNHNKISLRVYERGCGETLACGSGACAAVVSGKMRGLLASNVEVVLQGGKLQIEWQGGNSPVWMTGTATSVFHGRFRI